LNLCLNARVLGSGVLLSETANCKEYKSDQDCPLHGAYLVRELGASHT
jgi:hypothetical protein